MFCDMHLQIKSSKLLIVFYEQQWLKISWPIWRIIQDFFVD
jgi:hypothetical protein